MHSRKQLDLSLGVRWHFIIVLPDLVEIMHEKRNGVLTFNSLNKVGFRATDKEEQSSARSREKEALRLAEKRSRLHSLIFPNTLRHTLPSKQW